MQRSLDSLTVRRSELARRDPDGELRCVACAHRCRITEGGHGVCRMRRRDGEALLVPFDYVAGVAADPIEKKPFFHLLPGSRALSFGMLGCNLHCSFCQNWLSSQAGRDPSSGGTAQRISASDLVALASQQRCQVITSTYNEPLITAEWAQEVFTLARQAGLRTSVVSNGHATPEAVDFLAPVLDAAKVDLKAFRESTYASLGGRLAPVLETIRERKTGTGEKEGEYYFFCVDDRISNVARAPAAAEPIAISQSGIALSRTIWFRTVTINRSMPIPRNNTAPKKRSRSNFNRIMSSLSDAFALLSSAWSAGILPPDNNYLSYAIK